jgi:hypothetical protein
MTTATPAVAFALFGIALLPAQDTPAIDKAAKQRLQVALERLDTAAPAAIAIRWETNCAGLRNSSGAVSSVGNGQVQYVYSPSEWLFSARDQLIRLDSEWVGPKQETRPPGSLPGLLAAARAQPFDLVHRDVGQLDNRPIEWLTLRLNPSNVLDLSLAADDKTPAARRFRIGLPVLPERPRNMVRMVEAAFAMDPGPREVRIVRMRCQYLTTEQAAAEPGEWREGLPVRTAREVVESLVEMRLSRENARPLPPLDLELRTRLQLPQGPGK